MFYRVYKSFTGGTVGASIPVGNLRDDSPFFTGTTVNVLSTPTTIDLNSIISNVPFFLVKLGLVTGLAVALINEYFGEQCYNSKRFKQITKRGKSMASTRQKPRKKSTSRTKKTK